MPKRAQQIIDGQPPEGSSYVEVFPLVAHKAVWLEGEYDVIDTADRRPPMEGEEPDEDGQVQNVTKVGYCWLVVVPGEPKPECLSDSEFRRLYRVHPDDSLARAADVATEAVKSAAVAAKATTEDADELASSVRERIAEVSSQGL